VLFSGVNVYLVALRSVGEDITKAGGALPLLSGPDQLDRVPGGVLDGEGGRAGWNLHHHAVGDPGGREGTL
jgi:hypothetical protein